LPPAGGPGVASHAGDPCEKKGEKSKAEKAQRFNSCTTNPAEIM
jgi:hypothetical protein